MHTSSTISRDRNATGHRSVYKWARWGSCFIALLAIGLGNVDPARGGGEAVSEVGPALTREQRVEAIGYRLSEANADRCHKARALLGMRLNDIARYSASVRSRIAVVDRLGTNPVVEWVVPGSAASNAGLLTGDMLVAAGSTLLADYRPDLVRKVASYERIAAIERLIEEQIMTGQLQLTVRRRDGSRHQITLADRRGCISRFLVANEHKAAAWSDESGVEVTSGLVDLAGSDDALAFVIAHEMAHVIARDACQRGSPLMAKLGIGSKNRRASELAADAMAVELLRAARFDPRHAIGLLAALDKAGLGRRTSTHPPMSQRIITLSKILEND